MKNMMIFIILVISSTAIFAQSAKKESLDFAVKGFKPFPKMYDTYDRSNLIDKIIPDSKYEYWDCWYKDLNDKGSSKLMFFNGNFMLYGSKTKNVNPKQGFFAECEPGLCFTYIIGIKDLGKIDLINTEAKLKQFIGHIDNIEEVILLAKCYGYEFDSDTLIGGSYKERKNDYLLYLLENSYHPVSYKSVKAILSKDGNLRVLSKKTYKQTDDYFSF